MALSAETATHRATGVRDISCRAGGQDKYIIQWNNM